MFSVTVETRLWLALTELRKYVSTYIQQAKGQGQQTKRSRCAETNHCVTEHVTVSRSLSDSDIAFMDRRLKEKSDLIWAELITKL
jgi:hypothetical protein